MAIDKIEQNKELLVELEQLTQKEDLTNIYKEISDIRKKWSFARDEASYAEQELQDKFDGLLNVIYGKLKENAMDAENTKKDIINKAKELVNTNNFKTATNKMKELFDNWKLAGHTDKEVEDSLWEEFNTIRNEFYTKKQEYYDNLQKEFAKNEETKKSLIEEAKKALEIVDINELTKKMNELMDSWKATKSAGKDNDEPLWNEFKSLRQEYFTKKNDHYEAMKAVYVQRVEQKKEIIAQAKHCLACSEFTDEEINTVEELRKKWKEIGFAGKENENELWQQFSTVVNKYLDNMRYYK